MAAPPLAVNVTGSVQVVVNPMVDEKSWAVFQAIESNPLFLEEASRLQVTYRSTAGYLDPPYVDVQGDSSGPFPGPLWSLAGAACPAGGLSGKAGPGETSAARAPPAAMPFFLSFS